MLSVTDDDTLQLLLAFFDDAGDWPYVLNYESYGVLSAERTPFILDWKRIVIHTVQDTIYSVVRLDSTPPMEWEAVQVTKDGKELIGEPEHYTIDGLFEMFRDA